MSLELRILQALWFILPAYFANSSPLQAAKIKEFDFLGRSIDGGRKFNGIRLLGKGKTWRGLIVGVMVGTFAGAIQIFLEEDATILFQTLFQETVTLPVMSLELAFMLSLGTLVGDMVASFFKRQAGLKSGDPAPLLDQLDFVFGAFFFAWILTGTVDYDMFFILVVVSPVVHILANILAWISKLKRDPW